VLVLGGSIIFLDIHIIGYSVRTRTKKGVG
jgi:hypothetical protein